MGVLGTDVINDDPGYGYGKTYQINQWQLTIEPKFPITRKGDVVAILVYERDPFSEDNVAQFYYEYGGPTKFYLDVTNGIRDGVDQNAEIRMYYNVNGITYDDGIEEYKFEIGETML